MNNISTVSRFCFLNIIQSEKGAMGIMQEKRWVEFVFCRILLIRSWAIQRIKMTVTVFQYHTPFPQVVCSRKKCRQGNSN